MFPYAQTTSQQVFRHASSLQLAPAMASTSKKLKDAVLKKPAADDVSGLKRPASWTEFAADPDEKDIRPISKQQRYIFDQCFKAPPGSANALPPHVKELHAKIREEKGNGYPKELNAIVNSIIPRDATYAWRADWSKDSSVRNFEELFRKQIVSHQQRGYSHTEICAYLGGGDLERGASNLNIGLKKQHVELKDDGFYYMKQVLAEERSEKTWATQLSKIQNLSMGHGEEVATQMQLEAWAPFSFQKDAGASSSGANGASMEAVHHASEAVESSTKLIQRVRKLVINMNQSCNVSSAAQGLIKQANEAISAYESTHVKALMQCLTADKLTTSDDSIKKSLREASSEFAALLAIEKEIAALTRASK